MIITYALKFGAGKIEAKMECSYHTKPKPGHFSIGLLLYFLFPTSTGFNFVFVSVQFSYGNSETFPTIFFLSLLIPPFFVECFFSLGFYFAWFIFSRVQNTSYFRENPIFCSALFFAWFLFSRV